MNSPAKFARGLVVPFKGVMLVMTSFRLFVLASIPILICISFVVMTALWLRNNPTSVFEYALHWVPGLQSFVDGLKIGELSIGSAILQGLFWVFLILFASYFSYLLLSLVGAPFYSAMATIVLKRKNVGAPPLGFFKWLVTTLKMITISLLKLIFFVAVGGVLFIFSFLPAGMLLLPICMCLLISYDCFDFAFESMTFSVRERWTFFYDHLPAFIGLAFILLLVGTIPGFFSLTLPFFIAGGADLFGDLHKVSKTQPPPPTVTLTPQEPPFLKGNT